MYMKKVLLFVSILAILIIGCSSSSSVIKAEAFKPFTLKIGQSAEVKNSALIFKFINVTQDSRCPSGVQCIAAGFVKVKVNIAQNGESLGDFELALADLPELASRNFATYSTIKLQKVDPYPKSAQEKKQADYSATFVFEQYK